MLRLLTVFVLDIQTLPLLLVIRRNIMFLIMTLEELQ